MVCCSLLSFSETALLTIAWNRKNLIQISRRRMLPLSSIRKKIIKRDQLHGQKSETNRREKRRKMIQEDPPKANELRLFFYASHHETMMRQCMERPHINGSLIC